MSICATRAHYQSQNLAENDIKLSNFCQKATKAPEDVKRIEIDRTDRCYIYSTIILLPHISSIKCTIDFLYDLSTII